MLRLAHFVNDEDKHENDNDISDNDNNDDDSADALLPSDDDYEREDKCMSDVRC